MEMVRIEWNRWPVNWPPSASYIASWDPNEPSYIQNCRRDVQPAHIECPFREKSSGLVVMAAVNGKGEVMVVRNTQRNYGHDVGSMVLSGHLIPSPRITPQLKYARMKLTPPSIHFSLATSSTGIRVLRFQKLLTNFPPPVFLPVFENLPRIGLDQRHSDILQEPGGSSTGRVL